LGGVRVKSRACTGGDLPHGQGTHQLARQSGLEHIYCRPIRLGSHGNDLMAEYLPAAIGSARGALRGCRRSGEAEWEETLAAYRRRLADPDCVTAFHTLVQIFSGALPVRASAAGAVPFPTVRSRLYSNEPEAEQREPPATGHARTAAVRRLARS
jgi:hypothetical protein